MSESQTLLAWLKHVFDHPVTDPEWYWAADIPISDWDQVSAMSATFIAETFEHAGVLLAPFSDAQLAQGFTYLISNCCSNYMYSLVEPGIPAPLRLRALRSFVPLFEQVMAARCSPHLSHRDEPGANPLNGPCYMWWDAIPFHGQPEDPARAEFDAEVIVVLRRLLTIPHDACRESALHGIGEWAIYYRSVSGLVDEFLAQTPDLRPELVAYAKDAAKGHVL